MLLGHRLPKPLQTLGVKFNKAYKTLGIKHALKKAGPMLLNNAMHHMAKSALER